MSEKKPIVFSGIQPSGSLNIGGYLGSLRNWVAMQEQYDCVFSLVDLHSITVKQDPQQLQHNFYDLLALYIACGLDPQKNIIFCQSHVHQHTELAWLLNCYTYIGELNRMTQFKDKSKKHAGNINVGLFDYPVLMAADILLYETNLVPVGEDQKQHVELTRDIAIRFNNLYGKIFTIPEVYHPPLGARIMGLQEPTKKMSKSDSNPNNILALLDPPSLVTKKIKKAVTDTETEVRFDPQNKPGISNLLTIFAAVTNQAIASLENTYQCTGYGKFKNDLAEALVAFITPIQNHHQQLRQDMNYLNQVLHEGAINAMQRANITLNRVKEAIGLIRDSYRLQKTESN